MKINISLFFILSLLVKVKGHGEDHEEEVVTGISNDLLYLLIFSGVILLAVILGIIQGKRKQALMNNHSWE